MQIQTEVQLKSFNTLNLDAVASYYTEIQSTDDLTVALDFAAQQQLNSLILSGGSNMLLPERIHALVLHMNIRGIELLHADEHYQFLQVGAGEVWHDFLLCSTVQQLYAFQILLLMPGLVRSPPVQNIGAYWVEVGEFIDSAQVYDSQTKKFGSIAAADCQFAYRLSIFKDD